MGRHGTIADYVACLQQEQRGYHGKTDCIAEHYEGVGRVPHELSLRLSTGHDRIEGLQLEVVLVDKVVQHWDSLELHNLASENNILFIYFI